LSSDYWVLGNPDTLNVAQPQVMFWKAKIERNQRRDTETDGLLREAGITPVRVWEHELRDNAQVCLERVTALIGPAPEDVRRCPM
jgi:DNA mismatch endonuclease (patch repair protein)